MNQAAQPVELRTPRLLLRAWRQEDRVPFAALNADPAVTEYFPGPLRRSQIDLLVDRIEEQFRINGWGLWAVEVVATEYFIGFVGLNRASFPAPFTPAIEVGWRLAHQYWHQGFATEAAQAALAYGFATLELTEIVSFTSASNLRSRRVMERLGMRRNAEDDFAHPGVPPDHSLSRHVLYRLTGSEWTAARDPERKPSTARSGGGVGPERGSELAAGSQPLGH